MKEKEIAEIAARMKNFEKEIKCESKDVTIKAFWEPCSDGSGVYVVDYYKGKTVSEANITYGGEDCGKWAYDNTHNEEHPKTFQNILNKLVEMLNEEETKEKIICKTIYLRTLIEQAKEGISDFIEEAIYDCGFDIATTTKGKKLTKSHKTEFYDYFELLDERREYIKEKSVFEPREIEPLKELCCALNIDVPSFFYVYVTKPTVSGDLCDVYIVREGRLITLFGYNDDRLDSFFFGWGYSCFSAVLTEAEKHIENLLKSGC